MTLVKPEDSFQWSKAVSTCEGDVKEYSEVRELHLEVHGEEWLSWTVHRSRVRLEGQIGTGDKSEHREIRIDNPWWEFWRTNRGRVADVCK